MFGLLDDWLERHRERYEARLFQSLAPEPWDEDATKWRDYLLLDAATYRPHALFDVAPIRRLPDLLRSARGTVWSPSQKYLYAHRVLPAGTWLNCAQGNRRGRVAFSGDVAVPSLYEAYDTRKALKEVWMSITPMEVLTLRAGVIRAKGDCVVYGLGLGYFLRKVCAKRSVTSVVVVERDPEVLALVRPAFEARYPEAAAKVAAWVEGDAFDYAGCADPARCHLFDVWPGYGSAWHDPKLQALKKRLPRLWAWGDVAPPKTRSRW